MIKFDYKMALPFVPEAEIVRLGAEAERCNGMLQEGTGAGADFLGWVSLPSSIDGAMLERVDEVARRLRQLASVVVVIGIGGSYLGARAVQEALGDPFAGLGGAQGTQVVYAGQNLSPDYLSSLLRAVSDRSLALIVVSKSGTTTEPAVAFRILREQIVRRYGVRGARERIVAVTDRARGALKKMADEQGYDTFVIPDDVGGRYSVLTPVGLLPLAVAGVDVAALVEGAQAAERAMGAEVPFAGNPALQYAAVRNALYRKGYKVELFGSYEPALRDVGEWWKQLYGESEGKQGRGIFPASVTFTTDLHSMGQYIQEGERMLFETIVSIEAPHTDVTVQAEADDADGLNFLAGRRLSEVNRTAENGVALAHCDGGVPNLRVTLPRVDAYEIGWLLYFFERACGVSGYLLGVNPFDQPGVEAYKKNMFALLGKPGYEAEGEQLHERLRDMGRE